MRAVLGPRLPQRTPRTLLARAGEVLRAQEAAVAIVLAGEDALSPASALAHARVLLVRRAARAGDPWSGDMAFPGGRRARDDADLVATALRECREETGLEVPRAAYVGALAPLGTLAPARARKAWPMLVSPFVFVVPPAFVAAPALPSAEVVALRWARLGDFARPELRTTRTWRVLGALNVEAPATSIEGDVVWGLTLQMVRRLLAHLAG